MLRNRAVGFAVALVFLTPVAFGLGLGTLKTKSALNEPFDARIEIFSASLQDFDTLTVKLADDVQFDRAGVDRGAVLLNLRFEVVSSEAGADYVRITTKDPVREPFLNFLLELNWANGRLVREYTVLLDPPLYDRNRQPVTSATHLAPTPAPPVATAPTGTTSQPSYAGGTTIGPVQANDTAWRLALAHRPDA
ncbi:MAG: type IV pilus assembly protein FimV, partial [Gammaproteobacteria bacterium]